MANQSDIEKNRWDELLKPGPFMVYKCQHHNLTPLEFKAGKRTIREVDNEGNMESLIDWKSNINSAHLIRVTKYFCPACKKIITAPEE